MEGAHKHGIDNAEDRNVGTDSQRERKQRRHAKTSFAPNHPQRVPDISREIVDHVYASRIVTLFLRLLQRSKPAARHHASFEFVHTRSYGFLDELLQMNFDLVLQIGIFPRFPEYRTNAMHELIKLKHHFRWLRGHEILWSISGTDSAGRRVCVELLPSRTTGTPTGSPG